MVKDGAIVGFGDVCPDEFHPKQTEVIDGISYVYPIDKAGVERKWRYARQLVEGIASMLRAKQTSYGYEIELGKTFGLYRTIWNDKRSDANEDRKSTRLNSSYYCASHMPSSACTKTQ